MTIITYLGFTLLSILIQFSVMDYIQERLQIDETPVDINISNQNIRQMKATRKPQALYYRLTDKYITPSTKLYNNISLFETLLLHTTTEFPSTVFEVIFDNTTVTENPTEESIVTSTEFENITEITLLQRSNHTTKPVEPKSKHKAVKCDCDLMLYICDIDCCCDSDCSEEEHKMFTICTEVKSENAQLSPICIFQGPNDTRHSTNFIEDLFCIAKTNLPQKQIVKKEYDGRVVDMASKMTSQWKSNMKPKHLYEFSKTPYVNNDPIWLLKNGSVYYMDLPSARVNNYCTERTEIKFLKKEKVRCNVKLSDLEMIKILEATEETMIISATELSYNSSTLNCSAFHCTKWKIIVCDKINCAHYNKSLHEPSCTDNFCKNLALRVDYDFYYHKFKIINASITLYSQKESVLESFMTQEINVQFYLANVSNYKIIRLSGNPGYLYELPIIVSFADQNHSEVFFNRTEVNKNYMLYPENINGACSFSNVTNNFLLFGLNIRTKCKLFHTLDRRVNGTTNCRRIQTDILKTMGLNTKIFVSPLGNPQNIKDEDWISLPTDDLNNEAVEGQYHKMNLELECTNLITKFSFMFTFADTSDVEFEHEFKIITAHIKGIKRNVTFDMEDASTVMTVDSNFIDVTKMPEYVFAQGPHINMHLPQDFFFPFSSNCNNFQTCNMLLLLLVCIVWCQIK